MHLLAGILHDPQKKNLFNDVPNFKIRKPNFQVIQRFTHLQEMILTWLQQKVDFQRTLTGDQFYQESYKSFVTANLQDNMVDFNRDFTGVPRCPT